MLIDWGYTVPVESPHLPGFLSQQNITRGQIFFLSVRTRFHGVLICIVRYAHFLTSTSPSSAPVLESADSKGPTFNSKTSTPPVRLQLSSPDFQHSAAPVRLASSSLQRSRLHLLGRRLCVFAGLLCVVGLRLHDVRAPARY